MSASSLNMPFLVSGSSASQQLGALPSRAPMGPSRIVRRRPDMLQGRALESLGHAIEYLIDSRMFETCEAHTPADAEAVQILSRFSREVFATCAEIVPVHQRFKQWASERLRSNSHHSLRNTSAR
jgi:hypothetical protein